VLVEAHLRDALIRLNPEVAAQPGRADEALYKLRDERTIDVVPVPFL
jgi:type I restriction enzyme, R subunit